ncbi:MAG TPA: type ISP restriction/modification enzyme [Terriglobales bacterium]|nr:type ISP restriction/modification enzyme [Terriglobales bacterium]
MLVQHLLTERIFRTIFHNPDFTRRNVVAQEIEKVIAALTSRSFNRDEFLNKLDRFYKAIEYSAENTTGFSEKQHFLNKVYERFFQGYSPKEADTHGIVYTPQPIVNFMVRSVEEILKKEFGRSLSDKGVHILDPFVGTGNFIVRIMQEIKTTALPYKYENELHCNEVMLLPYYIASMNIEHAYFDRTNEYKPFPGICLVDTFDMRGQTTFTEENTARIQSQNEQDIFVVTGNPPYNAWQVNENDNNKNRRYDSLDTRVSETYAASSAATNKNALSDPYVKAIRWASDRIKEEGIVAFVTNSGFVDALAADGMRRHLSREFDRIYVLDLGGNVRKNPKLSGTTHNVFGIQVGVSINLLVRQKRRAETRRCEIFYARSEEFWTKHQKYSWLDQLGSLDGVRWSAIEPNATDTWLHERTAVEFSAFAPLADESHTGIFHVISNGVQTNRDAWVYNYSTGQLLKNVERISELYNQQVRDWKSADRGSEQLDAFIETDDKQIKWSSRLKERLLRGRTVTLNSRQVRPALYRPFCKQWLYFDNTLIHRPGHFAEIVPNREGRRNSLIWLKIGSDWPYFALASAITVDQLPQGGSQCFPFYTYSEDGTNRRENITDWALKEFCAHYHDSSITKWDIFHYVYAVLHHPEYRQRYAANLRRELPRIPFVSALKGRGFSRADAGPTPNPGSAGANAPADPSLRKPSGGAPKGAPLQSGSRVPECPTAESSQSDVDIFRAFVAAGKRLAEIHVNYEQQPEYPLTKTEKAGEKLDWRVTKMRLSKDKTSLIYNQFLTLSGIPPQTYEYRLGNRSALEWVIDQYQVSTDKRSGITNDPNRTDDPEYIVRLIGQVITVSIETVKIVKALPPLHIAAPADQSLSAPASN